jgi:4-hydroxybenzoate polyprenyltransferase
MEVTAMKLNVKAVTISLALLWAASIFLVGLANLIWSGYGQAFLDCIASIYPGYKATASFGQVIVGTLYGLLDAAIGGAVFAWLYNCFAPAGPKEA